MTEVLPTGWTMGWSAEHCHWYYFNSALSVTQWHKPAVTQTLKPEAEPDPHLEADRALVRAMDSGDADAIEAAVEKHAPGASAGVLAHVRGVAQQRKRADDPPKSQRVSSRVSACVELGVYRAAYQEPTACFEPSKGRRADDPPKGRSLVSACYANDVENEGRQAPCDDAASLALATALQQQEYQQARHATGGASSAAARRAEAMDVRRHLYEGTPAEAAAPPPPLAACKGLSYAKAPSAPLTLALSLSLTLTLTLSPTLTRTLILTKAARPSGETKPELTRSAPTMQCAVPSVCVPRRPTRTTPSAAIRLLVDGGNVAFSNPTPCPHPDPGPGPNPNPNPKQGGNVAFRYGEANGRPGSFEWRGLRLCVEYFAARGVGLGA